MSFMRFLKSAALLAAAVSAPASALAGQPAPKVVVPDHGGGAVSGCYRVQDHLYGPYRMTFCLGRDDSYRVRGAGLDCRAGLDWYRTGNGRIEINLEYARCGRGAGWSADSLSCRFQDWEMNAKVVVPDGPYSAERLHCRYIPTERGYRPVSVTARRIS